MFLEARDSRFGLSLQELPGCRRWNWPRQEGVARGPPAREVNAGLVWRWRHSVQRGCLNRHHGMPTRLTDGRWRRASVHGDHRVPPHVTRRHLGLGLRVESDGRVPSDDRRAAIIARALEVVDRHEAVASRLDDDHRTGGATRRPAHVAATVAPIHPRGSPDTARNPAPAAACIHPVAVVKWRPAPVIARDPGPPEIGVGPVPIGAVGGEVGADDGTVGAPHISISRLVNPVTVGAQHTLKFPRIHLWALGIVDLEGLRRRSTLVGHWVG